MPRRSNAVQRLSLAAVALGAAGLLAPSMAAAQAKVGSVYTETNQASANQVVAFDRLSDGTLVEAQRVATGGAGAPEPDRCGFPPMVPSCPILDTQGSVSLNPAGTLLFAVNAGSDTISSFRVTLHGLQLVGQVPSGGDYPGSITTHGDVLYVLNEVSGNIAGFTFTGTGRLTPIAGSVQSLATHGHGGVAAQIGFDRTGRTLVVTERATSLIDTFPVTGGVAGPVTAHPTPGNATTPFGFAFDSVGRLVVSDALSQMTGAATTYRQTGGDLTPIDTKSTGGGAPCWVVVTPNNRYAYISNTTTKSIARFRLATDGALTLLGTTATPNTPNGPILFPTDNALSRDGRFLYVLIPSVLGPPISRIDEYRVGQDGSLTFLASTPENMPAGVSGLAAR